jgi:hypothetical protein
VADHPPGISVSLQVEHKQFIGNGQLIGKNGLFHDEAGGVWVLTVEGLKQVMGFDPVEEGERLAILSRLKTLESRPRTE